MKKAGFWLLLSFLFLSAGAQVSPNDTLKIPGTPQKPVKRTGPAKIKSISLSAEIESGLRAILLKYKTSPCTEKIWAQIRGEADNLLLGYFVKGKLAGVKSSEAYFVQMGTQTMTAADIRANKKILLAGIAEKKPAEFSILKIEVLPSSLN